jgi:anti-anti-sigma factor
MPEPAVTIVEQRPDLVLVHIGVETIDERNLEAVCTGVAAAGLASPQLPVAVDFARVNFMPSMTMAGLIQLSRQFRSRKQRLVLVNLQPSVRESLVLMRLDRVMEIQHDLSALTGGPK